MTNVALEGVTYVYAQGSVRALDGVDLAIRTGERVAVIGQNGSGKTTLVRHLNGLLRPATGRVLVGGTDAKDRTVAQLARSVGLAFQDPDRQIFSGSVRGEVSFGPRNVGVRGRELDDRVGAALRMVGLDSEAAVNPYDLGYSRRKLLVLASVLAMGTPVLVLDEPTTGQDARGVALVEAVVRQVAAEGRTVIAISHDMRFVAESFERAVVMREGRIILDGPPVEAFAEAQWPALASSFLEPPYPAVVGARLDLGSTPTDDAVVTALLGRR